MPPASRLGLTVFAIASSIALSCRCAMADPAELEELLASERTPAGIDITVETGGCTGKSDFEVTSDPVKNGEAGIAFRRLTRDDCKGFYPKGLKLHYSWTDLKLPEGTKLSVKNPIGNQAATETPPSNLKKDLNSKPGRSRQVRSGHRRSLRAKAARHRRIHRRRRHRAIRSSVSTHGRAHLRGREVHYCYKFAAPACKGRKHGKLRPRRHRRSCHQTG
jgi:hypothetical protein